jgi:hypothetical protein
MAHHLPTPLRAWVPLLLLQRFSQVLVSLERQEEDQGSPCKVLLLALAVAHFQASLGGEVVHVSTMIAVNWSFES